GACTHRNDPLRFRHLIVNLLQNGAHLIVDGTQDHQDVRLLWRKPHDFRAKSRNVIVRRYRRHEFYCATGCPEGIRPEGTFARPINEGMIRGREETFVLTLSLEFGDTHKL